MRDAHLTAWSPTATAITVAPPFAPVEGHTSFAWTVLPGRSIANGTSTEGRYVRVGASEALP